MAELPPKDGNAEDFSDSPTPVLSASPVLKLAILAGVPISGYALGWLLLVPIRQYYDWPDELGTFFALICSQFLFCLCWGAMFAYMIRRLNWPPRTCNLAVLPFVVVFVPTFFLYSAHRNYVHLAVYGVYAGIFANYFCWKFAYPSIDRKSIYRRWGAGPSLFQR